MSTKSLNKKQREEAITSFIIDYFQKHDSFTVGDILSSESILKKYNFKYLQNILLIYHQNHREIMDVSIHPITTNSLFIFHKPKENKK